MKDLIIEKACAYNIGFLRNPKGGSGDIQSLADKVINLILEVAGALAIIYLIYSGILYLTSAGNPDNAKRGQQGLINAVIGIVVITLAFFIVNSVRNIAKNL